MKNFLKIISETSETGDPHASFIKKFAEDHARLVQHQDKVRYPGREWEKETVEKLEKQTLELLLESAAHACKEDGIYFSAESLATGYAEVVIDGYSFDVFVRKVKRD